MDIDLLSKMIKELVMDHDRVSLPGLGTFVAETVPSSFSDKGYTVNPPYRKLSFRPVKENDSLLIDMYASANDVSREIAEKALMTFVDGLRDVLQSRKNVVFPGLGRMRATKENNFFFVADEDLDIYPEGFGLSPLSLKTHIETKEEVSAAMDVLKMMMEDVSGEAVRPAESVEPEPEAVLLPEQEPESESEPEPAPEQTESPEAGQSAAQETAVDAVPVQPAEAESAVPEVEDRKADGKWRKFLYVLAIVLLSILLMTVIYVVVARLFPDFIDNILYNAEEYDILHRS